MPPWPLPLFDPKSNAGRPKQQTTRTIEEESRHNADILNKMSARCSDRLAAAGWCGKALGSSREQGLRSGTEKATRQNGIGGAEEGRREGNLR